MHRKNRPTSRKRAPSRATVLLSGGIDSTACLAYYLEQAFGADALFIDYGQAGATRELRAATAVCRHFGVHLRTVRLTGTLRKGRGLIVARNAFLLSVAAMEFRKHAGVIALGIHSGTRYSDCSPTFVRKMQSVLDVYASGALQIGVPFLRWRKVDIWTFAQAMRVPLRLTYSCERGLSQPCGYCDSCRDLEALRASSHQQD
jgi:7-cyano-7-deazaguanine synthase